MAGLDGITDWRSWTNQQEIETGTLFPGQNAIAHRDPGHAGELLHPHLLQRADDHQRRRPVRGLDLPAERGSVRRRPGRPAVSLCC
jgi:hypothetical protein